MNISGKAAAGIVIVSLLLAAAYGTLVWNFFTGYVPPDDDDKVPEGTEFSSFKYTAVREDATATTVTSATTRVWYDENSDGVMQYSELGSFTESSGVYTTNKEDYPISTTDDDFFFWVQVYAANHWVTYEKVQMTGTRNSDGSAKSVGEIEVRQIDDALTWSGQANGVAFDTTDYNATLSGTSGTLEAEMILSAADKGLSSQIWNAVDYESVYGIDANINGMDYFIKWDSITEGANDAISVADSSILAETFFAAYSTIADKNDLVIDLTDFTYNYQDGTNWYCIKDFGSIVGDVMYNSDDANAPRPNVDFDFGVATASGTFLATYGIGLWYDVRYDQMAVGSWTKGTANALGTCGDAWGWIVV
jgi:hypothetical protein